MTGQLPRENGVWSNARAAAMDCPSHVRTLHDMGYRTAVVGKTHLWRTGPGPKPGLHAKTMDHVLAAWGFDHRVEVNDPIGTGSQGCAYTDFAKANDFEDAHRKYINDWIAEMRSRNPTPWAQPPSPAPAFKDIDSFIGQTAVAWLRTYEGKAPFYLQTQFTGPHDPYDGPQPFREKYRNLEIPIGNTAKLEKPTPVLHARLQNQATIARATPTQRRQWRINYFANISLIDYWIGELLRALQERGFADNTWIIFTSDHGEMLGDLGLMGKTVYFEPSIHIPLLIHSPQGTARRCDELIQQVDLTATLLAIGQAPDFSDSLGRSLVSRTTNGELAEANEAVYSELFGESTVITQRYKLTVNTATMEPIQLLDQEENPAENHNYVDDPDYGSVKQELVERFLEPLRPRLNEPAMGRYQSYVRQTGRLN